MQIEANITRFDLVNFNLIMLPRARSNRIFVAVAATGIFCYLLITKLPTSLISLGIAAGAAIVGAIVGLLVGFLISLICVLLTSTCKSGVLGRHIYNLTEEGLQESTIANESLQRWESIQVVDKSAGFIFLRINGYLFYLIPRRAFASLQEFESFWATARDYWQRAQQRVSADARNSHD